MALNSFFMNLLRSKKKATTWCASLLVCAVSHLFAGRWGSCLARAPGGRTGSGFLLSSPWRSSCPIAVFNHWGSNSQIGWRMYPVRTYFCCMPWESSTWSVTRPLGNAIHQEVQSLKSAEGLYWLFLIHVRLQPNCMIGNKPVNTESSHDSHGVSLGL